MYRTLDEIYEDDKYSLERRIRYRVLMDFIRKDKPAQVPSELIEMIVALHGAQYDESTFRRYLVEMLEHYG